MCIRDSGSSAPAIIPLLGQCPALPAFKKAWRIAKRDEALPCKTAQSIFWPADAGGSDSFRRCCSVGIPLFWRVRPVDNAFYHRFRRTADICSLWGIFYRHLCGKPPHNSDLRILVKRFSAGHFKYPALYVNISNEGIGVVPFIVYSFVVMIRFRR